MAGDEVETYEALPDEPEPEKGKKGFLARWVESRAEKAIKSAVSSGADHIEERAAKVVGSLYDQKVADLEERAAKLAQSLYDTKASDLEERAVRALRRAIEAESERIQKTIEHAVEVKKREVRLSLLVLVGAAVVYLVLYWLTHDAPGAPGAAG